MLEIVNILMVDDKPTNLLALEVVLNEPNYNLVKALSGEEALRHLLNLDFAVILLDVHMPGMSGFETAEMIRSRDRSRQTPIIFITAVSKDDSDVLTGYSLGAVDYVFKPIVSEVLRAKVAVFVELFRKTKELERSNRDLEEFAYIASHDLQQPLRMISSFVKLLEQHYSGKLDEKADKWINFAVDGANSMHEMINNLLEYSRVGTKGKAFETTESEGLLKLALANLRIAVQESGTQVTYDNLPTVRADRFQILRLFQNLIDNAIKFRGDESPRIHVSAKRDASRWVFSLQDNGIGVDPRYSDQIFVIFRRLHSSAKYPGSGMGLAICRKIVERHGGWIWVESAHGKGSTFFFSLPVIGDSDG
jgi:two-component system, sensor histidine kinase and response regulator